MVPPGHDNHDHDSHDNYRGGGGGGEPLGSTMGILLIAFELFQEIF